MGETDKPRGKPGRKPSGGVGRTTSTIVRATPEFRAWLDRLAAFDAPGGKSEDASISSTIERALLAYARSIKFGEVAPDR
jgi:hypothetical protein